MCIRDRCNCAGYSTAAVADLVFGMLIALYRNLIPCNEVVRHEGTKDGLVGMELEGKKFGVIDVYKRQVQRAPHIFCSRQRG